MIYLNKRITFDIYLLKEEIEQTDYMILYEDTDPSAVIQVGFLMRPKDVGEDDPSLFGDAWLFKNATTFLASAIETRSFFYKLYDSYGNTDFTSDAFTVDVCLTPSKPTLTTPVYDTGAGELTFNIGQ